MHMTSLFTILLSSSALAAVIPRLGYRSSRMCNGHTELCNRSYGNVTYLGSHDSFAYSSNPLALARTQEVNISKQLAAGARLLQAQAHMNNGVLHFCHTSELPDTIRDISGGLMIIGCFLFDGGSVVDYLKKVKIFLDANPNEVLTFIFTNPELVSVSDVWKPAFDASGITPLTFVPSSRLVKRDEWPTLGELIDAGKRVVVFLDKGADGSTGSVVDFVLPQFDMVWEDPYSSTDKNFPCRVDRITGPLSTDDHTNMINHNLNTNIIPIGKGILISDHLDAATTNGLESILAHANRCAPYAGGRAPNFVLLDYVNIGDGLAAVDRLNGF